MVAINCPHCRERIRVTEVMKLGFPTGDWRVEKITQTKEQ